MFLVELCCLIVLLVHLTRFVWLAFLGTLYLLGHVFFAILFSPTVFTVILWSVLTVWLVITRLTIKTVFLLVWCLTVILVLRTIISSALSASKVILCRGDNAVSCSARANFNSTGWNVFVPSRCTIIMECVRLVWMKIVCTVRLMSVKHVLGGIIRVMGEVFACLVLAIVIFVLVQIGVFFVTRVIIFQDLNVC